MIPDNAARIWYASGKFYLELPTAKGTSHTLTLNEAEVLSIVKARTAESRLGEAGDPTFYQLEKSRKAVPQYEPAKVRRVGKNKVSYTEEVAASIRDTIRKLGLA